MSGSISYLQHEASAGEVQVLRVRRRRRRVGVVGLVVGSVPGGVASWCWALGRSANEQLPQAMPTFASAFTFTR